MVTRHIIRPRLPLEVMPAAVETLEEFATHAPHETWSVARAVLRQNEESISEPGCLRSPLSRVYRLP
jgi:hypothetical protein